MPTKTTTKFKFQFSCGLDEPYINSTLDLCAKCIEMNGVQGGPYVSERFCEAV